VETATSGACDDDVGNFRDDNTLMHMRARAYKHVFRQCTNVQVSLSSSEEYGQVTLLPLFGSRAALEVCVLESSFYSVLYSVIGSAMSE